MPRPNGVGGELHYSLVILLTYVYGFHSLLRIRCKSAHTGCIRGDKNRLKGGPKRGPVFLYGCLPYSPCLIHIRNEFNSWMNRGDAVLWFQYANRG
jgi:hypothetical protein